MRKLRWMFAAIALATASVAAAADCIDFVSPPDGTPSLRAGSALASGDFDADGSPDLAVARGAWNRIEVHRGRGDGSFDPAIAHATGAQPIFLATGSIDATGPIDLLSVDHFSSQVAVLLGRGDATFAPWSNPAVGRYPLAAVIADFDGDGDGDVAVANRGWADPFVPSNDPGDVTLLLGNGDGTFVEGATYTTGIRATAIVAADLSGDGVIDLAVAHRDDDSVVVLFGNGDGTFTVGAANATGASSAPRALATGDFDGDSNTDLAVALSASNTVAVLLGNGDGTFSAAASFAAGTEPFSVVTADFDGDGATDLAVANVASNDVSVLRGLGDGTFEAALTFATGQHPRSIQVADFDGDGRQDLAVADESDDNFSVLLNSSDCATLDAIDPAVGPAAGGQTVILTGTHLAGTTAVSFGGVAAAFTVDSPTQITATTPPHAPGTVSVEVSGGSGGSATAAASYTFVAAPTITAISPDAGPATGGQVVTITGTALNDATAVTFGGVAAAFTIDSSTQITATTPPHVAGPVEVAVTTVGGTGTAPYTYIAEVTLSLTGSPMSEEGGSATVIATLSAASSVDVTVNLAFSGTATLTSDYTRSGVAIVISAGDTSGSITLTAVDDAFDEANETIIVDISSVSNGAETTPQQVTATIVDDDAPVADLSVTKTASPGPYFIGQPITYTITVTNAGPANATGVTVTDVVPAGTTFVSAVPSQGTCVGTTTITCSLGTLVVGADADVALTVQIDTAGPIENTASASADQADPTPANNTATAALIVGSAIPTLSSWMLFALTAMFTVIVTIQLRSDVS